MKKILNWTFGSVFRTFGRIIAYLLVGSLIALIMSENHVKISDIFSLGVKKEFISVESDIKLASNDGFYVGSATYSGGANGTYINTNLSSDGYWIIPDSNLTTGSKTLYFKFNGNKTFQTGASEYYVNIKFSYNRTETSTTTESQYRCNIHSNKYESIDFTNDFPTTDYEWVPDYFTCNQHTSTTTTNSPSYSLTLYYTYGDNDYNYIPCNAVSNAGDIYAFKCPVGSSDIRGLRISVGTTSTNAYTLGFSPTSRYYIDQQQQIIDNQQTQIQQQQQTQQTITNDNTDESQSTANSFFSGFTSNTHGLTGIISAPLTAIQSLTSKTCSPLVLPLPFMENQNLTLPCMRAIYEEHFGDFMNLYDVIILGIVSYWIMVRVFAMVKDFKNPDHDEIEVVDL